MLPAKLHLTEIQRFHDTLDKLNKRIDQESDETTQGILSMHYYKLVKLWTKIDDFVEYTVKQELDNVDQELKKVK